MKQLLVLWSSFDLRRRAIIIVAGVGMFAAVLGLTRLAISPNMSLLYSGLEDGQAGEVIRALEQRAVVYLVRGGSIYVDSDARDKLRMTLASEGLPANGSQGYELLDGLSGFGTTSQMFDAAYWRAKEGELARTIVGNANISAARVHIANTGSNLFLQDQQPTGSVTLTTRGGPISANQAKAFRFLVASAVAGLLPENVSVIDSVNGLINSQDDNSAATDGTDRETALRNSITRLIEARVGRGNAVVEVSIETVTETESIRERLFDPNSRVAISTETEEHSTNSKGMDGGTVTVASNLPDGDVAGGGESSNENSQTRERVNYEVSETQREVTKEPGAVKRITTAVLVNGVPVTEEDGTTTIQPRDEKELAVLRELVESAIGFDAERGDLVTLKSMAFEPVAPLGSVAAPSWVANLFSNPLSILQMVVLGAVALSLGLFVLRPLLTRPAAPSGAMLAPPAHSEPSVFDEALSGEINPDTTLANTSLENAPVPLSAPEDPVERLRALISNRQEETVEVLRSWLEDKEEPAR